jgi:DNA mismatch repair protein MutS2
MKPQAFYSLETLEFGKALGLFERYLRTPLSLPLLRASAPATDHGWLDTRYREIGEARGLLEIGKRLPFDGITDIRPTLVQAEMPGSSCDGPELVKVLQTLRGIRLLRKGLLDLGRSLASLDHYFHRLVPMNDLEERLAACLEEDGTLKDAASPALKKLRERIRRQRSHIQKRLEEMCRHPDIRAVLQEEYFTERNGRYVLPVQSSLKKRVPGIQHGKSVTGTTAYIEPFDLVESGNLLTEAIEEETIEVATILKELTGLLRERAAILAAVLDAAAELDLVVSLAEYSLEAGADLPTIVESGNLELRGIRHPLLLAQLPREAVVANDFILEAGSAGLVITGPNTGGKTVVMKSAGLLCLLALAGLPIPCGPGTTIPLLGGVLADIGDDQSIEESLSTFSSHVSRMKSFHDIAQEIQNRSGYRPLVILDELGAGTDPAEGSALGRALVENLIRLGAWVLVATHLGDLKLFGYGHPGLKSGAMRFDAETLSPTYQLLMDSVGESHGLEIAQRLGLPGEVIARAEELIKANPNQAASLLHRLTEEEKRARDLREEIEKTQSEIEEKKETLVRRIEQAARDERRILDEARRTAEQKIQAAKRRMSTIEDHIHKEEQKLKSGYDGREKEIERREMQITWMEKELERRLKLVADLAKKFPSYTPDLLKSADLERLARLSEPEWKQILRQINEEEHALASDFPKAERKAEVDPEVRPVWEEIAKGDVLRVEGIERPVVVEEKDDKRKRLAVSIGNLQSEVPFDRVLVKTGHLGPEPVLQSRQVRAPSFAKPDIGPEINLIGMTLDEMEPLLMKYLDDAILSHRDTVRIIHGHGQGILRKGVQRILRAHPLVAKFNEAEAFEGGAGATVAVLKG